MREHFLAHWLLWKAYPGVFSIKSAFMQMVNKNPKSSKPFQGRITSRVYASLKNELYTELSRRMSGKLYVKVNGNTTQITTDEYKSGNYTFHTAGKVNAFDTTDNTWKYITTEEYKSGKYTFHTAGKLNAFDTETNEWSYIHTAEYSLNKARYITRLTDIRKRNDYDSLKHLFDNSKYSIPKFEYINIDTAEVVKLTKTDASNLNKIAGKKLYKQLQIKNVACIDSNGAKVAVPLKEYNPTIHQSVNCKKISVVDTYDNCKKSISSDEYYQNTSRYITSTKGKVLTKDETGRTLLLSKDEFIKKGGVGQTKGLTTVFDKITGEYTQITREEFKKNKIRYQGPASGKLNVINIQTGIRSQINKDEFIEHIHLPLGNKKFLFKCQNILTFKEKYINIYEWKLVFNHYTIIEKEKFNALIEYIQ